MSIKIVNPFTNIKRALLSEVDDTSKNGGTYLSDLRELNIGNGGNNVFRADKNGIWLGSDKFSDAPFRVNMSGALVATSATISGFITVGGAASDVNSNSTTISGGKITANSISADKMVTNTLVVGTNVLIGTAEDSAGVTSIIGGTVTASFVNALNITAKYVAASVSLTSPSIYGGTIAIGSSNSIFKADSNGIYLGNATFSSAPFRVAMNGHITATDITITGYLEDGSAASDINSYSTTVSGSKLTGSTVTYDKMNISKLSAITANLGTITAGTISGVTFNVSSEISVKDGTTEVLKINKNAFIAREGKAFSAETASGVYCQFYGNNGTTNDGIIELPDSTGNLKVMNYNSTVNLFTVNQTKISAHKPFKLYSLYSSPSGAEDGWMYYNTHYDEVWVYKAGAWKALAYVA